MKNVVALIVVSLSMIVVPSSFARCMKDGKRVKGIKTAEDCATQDGKWKEKKKKKKEMVDGAKGKLKKAKDSVKDAKEEGKAEAVDFMDDL
jgi:hypothetical protein